MITTEPCTQFSLLEEEVTQNAKVQFQKQATLQKKKYLNRYVGLLNTGNLCYLNSTIQVIFSMPIFCEEVIKFFESKNPKELNHTTLSFIKKLKEKQSINEGSAQQNYIDLSELRQSFNIDLEKRHRDADNTFGRGQQDSSEFYILLFEFLIKFRKDQDLKKKNHLLGVSSSSNNPAYMVDKGISKGKYEFGSKHKEYMQYFTNETEGEQKELSDQLAVLQKSLNGLQNPVEEYFYNGYILSNVGPCKYCGYNSLSIIDFAFFELNYPENRWSSSCDLTDMIDKYFKSERVNARCKNQKCDKYPVNIVAAKRDRTLYFETKKYIQLIKLPKMLKIMFKKYDYNPYSYMGSRISNYVKIPVVLKSEYMGSHFYKPNSTCLDKNSDQLLTAISTQYQKYNYYLFAYSVQKGSLDSGHYVTYSLSYYVDAQDNNKSKLKYYYVCLNDSSVSEPIEGDSISKDIECDAYWVMYVREDQEDFQEQLKQNVPPKNLVRKQKSKLGNLL